MVFPLQDSGSGQIVNLCGWHTKRGQYLYLPGPNRGVFNPHGARNAEDVILTESVIDAAAVWSTGLRTVIPVCGANGLIDELIAHLRECHVTRAVLMLDNDETGRPAAEQMQARLEAAGINIRPIKLPLAIKDVSEWVAGGAQAADLRALIAPGEPAGNPQLEKLPEGVLRCVLGEREYRVRGLSPLRLNRLKVNLRVSADGAFHLDTLDLYRAQARANFAQTAAKLCRIEKQQINADLLALIDPLERVRLEMKKM